MLGEMTPARDLLLPLKVLQFVILCRYAQRGCHHDAESRIELSVNRTRNARTLQVDIIINTPFSGEFTSKELF